MSEPEPASLDARRRRLLYRATHRGTYENDILLGGFVQRHIDALPESELAALEALLELPDNELADWLTGRLPIPPEADGADAAAHPRMRRLHAPPPPAPSRKGRGRACADDRHPGLRRARGLGRLPARPPPRRVRRPRPARHPRRCADGAAGRGAGLRRAGGGGAALPRLGLPALRPRVAEPGAGLRAHRHAGAAAGKADRPAHRADHGERAGAARAAARGVRRRQPGTARQRHGPAGEARPLPGSQRLRPRRHRDGAGRIRHARRHHRHLPGRRGGPGAARPVRRHDRVDPHLRSRHPAQRRSPPAPDPAAGVRGAARPGRDLALPLRLARDCSASRRPTTRSTCRSRTVGGIPAWSTGCRCSTSGWRRCSTICPAPRSAWTIRRTRCWRRGWR